MEVTRQLRLDALNKHGTAWLPSSSRAAGGAHPSAWAGAAPKHWDERRQHVKDKADADASTVNQVLDNYSSVAAAAERAATEAGQVLAPAAMRAEVERRPRRAAGRARGGPTHLFRTLHTLDSEVGG